MDYRLEDALRELDRHCGPHSSPYWWRQASMQKLTALGYAEPWHPGGVIRKRPAYRITSTGRAALGGGKSAAEDRIRA